jgi:hypothetical protein
MMSETENRFSSTRAARKMPGGAPGIESLSVQNQEAP